MVLKMITQACWQRYVSCVIEMWSRKNIREIVWVWFQQEEKDKMWDNLAGWFICQSKETGNRLSCEWRHSISTFLFTSSKTDWSKQWSNCFKDRVNNCIYEGEGRVNTIKVQVKHWHRNSGPGHLIKGITWRSLHFLRELIYFDASKQIPWEHVIGEKAGITQSARTNFLGLGKQNCFKKDDIANHWALPRQVCKNRKAHTQSELPVTSSWKWKDCFSCLNTALDTFISEEKSASYSECGGGELLIIWINRSRECG